MKQTAVEFAVGKLEQFIPKGNQIAIKAILEHSKEMERQQERMYSEEDLEKAFKVGFTLGYGSDVEGIDDKDECFNRWFKIFKDNQDEKNHN
jgi:hypothetical protein